MCWQAFRIFDRNGNGKIDKEEIKMVLNDSEVQSTAAKDLAEIMQEVDTSGDGEIDFNEFRVFCAQNKSRASTKFVNEKKNSAKASNMRAKWMKELRFSLLDSPHSTVSISK